MRIRCALRVAYQGQAGMWKSDDSTRARLLRIPDLTLEASINSCRAIEASKRELKELNETNENSLGEVRVKHAKRKKQSTHGPNCIRSPIVQGAGDFITENVSSLR